MPSTVEVVGVYPVEASEPVHLIELLIKECVGKISISEITQEVPGQPQSNWQVPYEEKILNGDGTSIKSNPFFGEDSEEDWLGDVRLAFFFHYLDQNKPLKTPFGEVLLPGESAKPERLNYMEYEQPY